MLTGLAQSVSFLPGVTAEDLALLFCALFSGVALAWSKNNQLRSKRAREVAGVSDERSSQSMVAATENAHAIVVLKDQLTSMAVELAELRSQLALKESTIELLTDKVTMLEATVDTLRKSEDAYHQEIAELNVKLEKANTLIERIRLEGV